MNTHDFQNFRTFKDKNFTISFFYVKKYMFCATFIFQTRSSADCLHY